jgi:hypothetical protein
MCAKIFLIMLQSHLMCQVLDCVLLIIRPTGIKKKRAHYEGMFSTIQFLKDQYYNPEIIDLKK